MNILYLNHYAGSPEMGMEYRTYYLSREWVRMGHKVTIIAGDYSHLRKINPSIEMDFQQVVVDGIEYIWIKTGSYQGNNSQRAISMFRFVWKLWNNAKYISKNYNPDVVISSSTYPLDSYPALKIARLSGAKYVHEVHDLWPLTLYEIGGMSKYHPFVVLMQFAENYSYKHCDKCVSLPPYAKEYMIQHGLKPEKFINIQNGVLREEWKDNETIPKQHESFFEEHKGKFIVGYFGGHALSNALDYLLDVAKIFTKEKERKDIIFVLVGNGSEKSRLMERAKKERLMNLFFLPPVNKKAIPNLLTHFDCSYMTGKPSPLYRFGLSLNKMYDSMMAGLPIVCVFDTPETLIRKYQCGYQCSPYNNEEVVHAINQIAAMSVSERKQMGQNGKRAILKHFTYDVLANEFIKSVSE